MFPSIVVMASTNCVFISIMSRNPRIGNQEVTLYYLLTLTILLDNFISIHPPIYLHYKVKK